MTIPTSNNPPLVRTDFSDEAAWQAIRAAILTIPPDLVDAIGLMNFMNAGRGEDEDGDEEDEDEPDEPWFVDIIDERLFADLSTAEVLKRLPADCAQVCLFIVDRQTISDPDHPILVIDLLSAGSRTFRTLPTQVWDIGSNLPISNVSWEDYERQLDEQSVYRGATP